MVFPEWVKDDRRIRDVTPKNEVVLWVSNSSPLYLTPTNQTVTFGWDGSIQDLRCTRRRDAQDLDTKVNLLL